MKWLDRIRDTALPTPLETATLNRERAEARLAKAEEKARTYWEVYVVYMDGVRCAQEQLLIAREAEERAKGPG